MQRPTLPRVISDHRVRLDATPHLPVTHGRECGAAGLCAEALTRWPQID